MIEVNPRNYLPISHEVSWTCPRCNTSIESTLAEIDETRCPSCKEPWLSDAKDRRTKAREMA